MPFRAVGIGVLMACVLGAANAYLGMKVGLTVVATFPAAVVAMAALRPFKGSILEENTARTTASVGEALVAGSIFTIPAFIISGVWEELYYWESTLIMLIGGILGVLFVIVLRRTLVEEAELPFPESVAAAELVKAGQGGAYVFVAMGLAALWEFFKNSNGIPMVADYARTFVSLGSSQITLLAQTVRYRGGLLLETVAVSPALIGVGFIVGPGISANVFSGAVMGWLFLVPLSLFLNPELTSGISDTVLGIEWSEEVWRKQVRPLAVGSMIVAFFHTLFKLQTSLIGGFFLDFSSSSEDASQSHCESWCPGSEG